MRIVHWLFIVSSALFVFGLGFVVVGARFARQAPVAAERAPIVPIATMKQIMSGIVNPASTVIFNAVSFTVTAKGTDTVAPRNDAEWAVVGTSAAALAEAGNLLMVDGRAVDRGDWIKMSLAMIDAGRATLKAVEAKDPDAVLAVGENVNRSCDDCHQRYRRY